MSRLIDKGLTGVLCIAMSCLVGCGGNGTAVYEGRAIPSSHQKLVQSSKHKLVRVEVEPGAYVTKGTELAVFRDVSRSTVGSARAELQRANVALANVLNINPKNISKGVPRDWRLDAWKKMYDERYIGLAEYQDLIKGMSEGGTRVSTAGLSDQKKREIKAAQDRVNRAKQRVKDAQRGKIRKWYAPIDGVVMPGGIIDQTQDPLGVMSSAGEMIIAEDNLIPVLDVPAGTMMKAGQPIMVAQTREGSYIEGEIVQIDRGIVSRKTGKLIDRVIVKVQFPGYLISGQRLYFKQSFGVGWWDNMKAKFNNMVPQLSQNVKKKELKPGVYQGDLSLPPTGDASLRTELKLNPDGTIEGRGVDPDEFFER